MKQAGFVALITFFLLLTPFSAIDGVSQENTAAKVKQSNPVEVYYFHLSRRCMTCQTVEKVAEEAVKENFSKELERGDVVFKSVNLEEKANKDLMKKLKVSGQSLLIVDGKEKVDITDKGFLYAVNEPQKLKSEIKSQIGKFLN